MISSPSQGSVADRRSFERSRGFTVRVAAAAMLLVLAPSTATAQVPPVPTERAAGGDLLPRAALEQRILDLGEVIQGDVVPLSWTVRNVGTADLVIAKIHATCGCTVLDESQGSHTVPPGEAFAIRAEFNSKGRSGPQNKKVKVLTNDPNQPEFYVEFRAEVTSLYVARPVSVFNLRTVQRGETLGATVDLFPATGRSSIKVLGIDVADPETIRFRSEELQPGGGVRLVPTIGDSVSLGRLSTKASVRLDVDGIQRTHEIPIRGEVVGELTWRPEVLDATRLATAPGHRLAPVYIERNRRQPFDILSAEAPGFDITVAADGVGGTKDRYKIELSMREDITPGPMGTTLRIRTDMIDQPVVDIPVFANVGPHVAAEPPVVLLVQDGTQLGQQRIVRIVAAPTQRVDLLSATSSLAGVTVESAPEAGRSMQHIKFLRAKISEPFAPGVHEGMISVSTGVSAMPILEIPVTVRVGE